MISLAVEAADGGAQYYGKKASELQENVTVSEDAISGTLKKVEDYAEAFPGAESGHFLALTFTFDEGTTVKTKVIGGKNTDVDATKDKYCVYRIENKDTQQIQVTATKGGQSVEKTYSLAQLVLSEN